jgi:hypothetical protein
VTGEVGSTIIAGHKRELGKDAGFSCGALYPVCIFFFTSDGILFIILDK